jgi:manganese/iron transport system permease protein
MMESITSLLLEPLSYPFMQRALIIAVVTGVVCAVFSCYLVLKGWSLMGDAISHAVLPGIVIAYIAGFPFVIGAFIAGVFCATGIGYISENCRVKEDTVMGIVFSGMFAMGLVMFSKIETDQHLLHILFGNMLGITWAEITDTAIIAGIVLLVIGVKWRDFLLYCFDASYAKVIGLPVKLLHFGLLMLLSLTIVASLKAVGIILVIAMLIAPGAIAFILTNRFRNMLIIAVLVAVFSCISGVYVSYYIDAATGPTIVVIQSIIFIIAFIASGKGVMMTQKDKVQP